MLNEAQLSVLNNMYNDELILAPAGTGKTNTICNMLTKYLEDNNESTGREVLVLTFTNRAAKELDKRVQEILPEHNITIGTFHGFCYKQVSHYADEVGLPDAPIITTPDFIDEVIDDYLNTVNPENSWMTSYIRRAIGICSSLSINLPLIEVFEQVREKISKENLVNNRIVGSFLLESSNLERIYSYYTKRLKIIGAINFDQIISYTLRLIKDCPDVLKSLQERYQFIFIDEFQDTSDVEMEIITSIVSPTAIYHCFGDINQTIYTWRGSNVEHSIKTLKELRPNLQTFSLDVCYRSTEALISFANQVTKTLPIHPNVVQSISTSEEKGIKPVLYSTSKSYLIGKTLLKNISQESGSIAILVRNNGLVNKIDEYLRSAGYETLTSDYLKILKQPISTIITDFFKLATNPYSSNSFRHIIQYLMGHTSAVPKNLSTLAKQAKLPFILPALENIYTNFDSAFADGKVAVVDIESTGISTSDHIVQIAAVLVNKEGILMEFEVYVSGVDVGESVNVHHISNEFLAEHGVPIKEALQSFEQFLRENDVRFTVGHNYQFDINKINMEYCKYFGSPLLDYTKTLDTLALAPYYFPKAENYKLSTLSDLIQVKHQPTHNALDDVCATFELLQVCSPKPDKNIYFTFQDPMFKSYSDRILDICRQVLLSNSLSDAVQVIINSIGNIKMYIGDEAKSIGLFMDFITQYEACYCNQDTTLLEQIADFLSYSALHASEVILPTVSGKPPIYILTIHMAKGLEFDNVHIVGIDEKVFPTIMANKGIASMDEEFRLLYVAVTRAKHVLNLYTSTPTKNQNMLAPLFSMKSTLDIVDLDSNTLDQLQDPVIEPTLESPLPTVNQPMVNQVVSFE